MRKLGTGQIGRVGALAFAIVSTIVGCGDNGVTPPPDAPDIDAPPPKPAVLSMMPAQNDFGSVLTGNTSGTASFTVTNTGEATSGQITPVITGTNAGDFLATNGCTTLAGGGTCVVTVVFKPTSAGTKSASLVVSGSPGGTVMGALLGTGGIAGTIIIAPATPSSYAFGNVVVGATGTQQTFTFKNDGTVATSAIITTAAGNDPGEFTKVSDNCNGQTLAAQATCTVVVNFRPTSPGGKNAQFTVSATTGGQAVGAVSGTGVAQALLTLTPQFQDFGTVPLTQSSNNVSFTVQNVGGVASGAITNTGTGDYTIVNSTCAGVMLAPLATCTITVRFTPTAINTRAGTLDVAATPGGTKTATLTGVGTTLGDVRFAVTDSPFAFPGTTVGQVSSSHQFTITNTGGTATGALSTALGGNDPSQFSIVAGSNGCQGTVLAAGASCTIVGVFNPTSGGNKTATLTVSGTPGGVAVASISGLGIAPAQFDFDIDSRDYGSVVTGTQGAIQTFRVTNIGGQNSAIPAAAVNGVNASEFMITSNTCNAALTPSPAAGSFCDISVQFLPVTNGPKVATLDVLGTPGGPISAGLSGIGQTQASLAVSPSILTFPLTLVGNSSLTQSFTVENQGSVTTGVLSVTVIGAAAADYTQTNNCEDGPGPGTDTLIAGGLCTVNVTFSPTARGARNAQVQIQGTPGGTVTTAVNGTSLPRLEILTPAPVTIPNTFNFGSQIVDPNGNLIDTELVTVVNNTATAQTITNTETDSTSSFFPTNGCGTVNGAGVNIGAGATCTFVVGFAPHQLGAVSGQYTLSIGGTATGCPVALPTCNNAVQQVNGVGTINTLRISDGDALPTEWNFGNQGVGTSSQVRVFTVTNLGTTTTGILAVDLAGAGFQITNNQCSGVALTSFGAGTTPAAGATCTIGVVFTPAMTGSATGTITVRTSTGMPTLGGTVTAMVTGTGVAAAPLANPTMLDWGILFAGDRNTANTDKVFVITNPNDVTTNVSVVVNNGTSAYVQVPSTSNNCGPTLGPGQFCNVTIRFTPDLPAGPRPTATVDVVLSVGALQASVSLNAAVRSTLSIVAAPTPFTNQVVNTTASQTIMVHNDTTNQTLNSFAVNAGGAPFFILNNNCTTLAPGGTCMFDIQYAPTLAGTNNQNLTVTANNSTTNSQTGAAVAQITANAITAANVVVDLGAYSFGAEIVGQNGSTRTFTFTNIGQQTSGAFVVSLSSGATDYTITAQTCGAALAFNASCTVTVRFNPSAAGSRPGALTGVGTPGGTPGVVLSGTGIAAGGVRVTPTAVVFPDTTAGQTSAAQTFTVQNTNAVTAATLTVGTGSADFTRPAAAAGGTCTGTLAAGASCTVNITFTPGTAGPKVATLTIDGATFASLTGTGLTIANVTANAGGIFSNNAGILINDGPLGTPANATPSPSVITVAGIAGNVTNLRVRIKGFTHGFPEDVDVQLVSPSGVRFTLMSDVGCSAPANGLNLTFEDGAAAGLPGLTAQDLTFPPVPLSSGTFKPTDYAGGCFGGIASPSDTFPLGVGLLAAPASNATLASAFNGTVANGNWLLYVVDDAMPDAGSIAGWDLEINNPDFGIQAIGTTSAPRVITLTNNGQTAATALVGTVSGADATHFAITDACNGVALAPGASCNLTLAFAPTTTGVKNATITYTGGSGVNIPIILIGSAVNPASLSITPSVPTSDGSRPIGQNDTAATTWTISNAVGSATTSGIAFDLTDDDNFDFAPGGTCSLDGSQTLAAGANCTVQVFFNPTELGPQTTNVVAMAASGGTVTVVLNGTGTQALVQQGALPVFTPVTVASLPQAGNSQTITFANLANVPTSLVQTVLTNTAGSDFSVVDDQCGGRSLNPNGQPLSTCTVTVHFTPSGTAGARNANLVLSTVVTGTTTTATVALSSALN